MIKKLLERIGLTIGRPRTLSSEENQSLRGKGLIKEEEIAWETSTLYFIQDTDSCEMRVLYKSSLPLQ